MIEHYFDCPHCWENQLRMIDSSIEIQNFIEDCEVCCHPIEFDLVVKNNLIELFSAITIDQ
ncbi:CPXCG motif-containing cysteine-rich protein [Flavobacteriales bacterium]|nr:CPXCG motif-containing cysteine-rich protein [Flavobacteriales bacterium]